MTRCYMSQGRSQTFFGKSWQDRAQMAQFLTESGFFATGQSEWHEGGCSQCICLTKFLKMSLARAQEAVTSPITSPALSAEWN